MANLGLWKKEIGAGKFKFTVGLVLLIGIGVFITMTHEFTINLLENEPIPNLKQQLVMFKDYRFWIWSQWFGKNLLQIGSGLALIFGSGIISSEVSRKTIYFLLSKPIRREKVFTVKYVVNLLILAVIVIISTMALYAASLTREDDFSIILIIKLTIMSVAGMTVLFSIAAYLSTVFNQTSKSLIISFLLAVMISIPDYLPGLKKFSMYYQMAGYNMYIGESFPVIPLAILMLISSALYVLGRNRFVKRDI